MSEMPAIMLAQVEKERARPQETLEDCSGLTEGAFILFLFSAVVKRL